MNCWGRFGILKSKRNSERESREIGLLMNSSNYQKDVSNLEFSCHFIQWRHIGIWIRADCV